MISPADEKLGSFQIPAWPLSPGFAGNTIGMLPAQIASDKLPQEDTKLGRTLHYYIPRKIGGIQLLLGRLLAPARPMIQAWGRLKDCWQWSPDRK
jgi:hypothetical protein